MTSSLSGHQDYSACFQDQLERLQQLHLDQSEYVCLKALILFSSGRFEFFFMLVLRCSRKTIFSFYNLYIIDSLEMVIINF
ncbi:unnamed protein product [Heterobilharzia americana]|nr:unnamed protein product [Heterobilharzia americana]